MANSFDFKKLRHMITIHNVIQVFLVVLLIWMEMHFQARLQAEFMTSVKLGILFQLLLFFPIMKLATFEANREVNASEAGLGADAMKSLRTKRMVGDVLKSSVFIFFVVFSLKLDSPLKSNVAFLCFILTFISYFQIFNFVAKREMKTRQ